MYIDFMTQYWYLFAMLFVIVLLLSLDPLSRGAAGSKAVTPSQVPPLQTRQHAVIVDLRDSEKFTKAHISQAINIPFSSLDDSIGKIRKHQKKPIVLVCESGTDSRKAVSVLQKNEFADIYSLTGGLTAWRKENLPLEKS